MRITPNVYLLSGFAYGLHPNAYGVTIPGDEEHMILIDTGLAEPDRMMIEKNRAYWGLDKRKISHVLLTHSHFDHSGNALYYYEQGAKIVMSEADAIAVSSGNSRTIDYAYAEKFPACPVDIRVKDGDVLDILDLRSVVLPFPVIRKARCFLKLSLMARIFFLPATAYNPRLTAKVQSSVGPVRKIMTKRSILLRLGVRQKLSGLIFSLAVIISRHYTKVIVFYAMPMRLRYRL